MKKHSSVLATLLAIAMLGCSGGGPSGSAPPAPPPPPSGTPTLQVLPASFDFGRVTTGNASLVAPLEVTVRNTGNAPLSVTAISAAANPNFAVSLTAGASPCGAVSAATPKVVAAGAQCTFQVSFQPTANGTFTSAVNIASNGGAAGVPISGTSEAVASPLTVRINQVETACSSNPNSTAYVSVTDQGGFPVLGLTAANFTVTQPPSTTNLLLSASFVGSAPRSVAIATALDHSSSLTDQPVAFSDMKTGVATFFADLKAGDIGEVVNFDSEVEVVQPFTSDKALLQAAALAPWDKGGSTRLYDAVYQAIDDAAAQASFRRAVIVTTDGQNTATPSRTLDEAIARGVSKGVAVFTVGLGSTIDEAVLRRLADETGGVFYRADVSQNLATIYRQLSTLLLKDQYVLTFNQLPQGSPGIVSTMTVSVVGPSGQTGTSPPANITSCN